MYGIDLLVNKQGSLSISCITHVKAAATFDRFIVKIIFHLRLRIPINEPEQVRILIFNTVCCIVLPTQESWCLSHLIMRGSFNIKVLWKVWRCLWTKVDFWREIRSEFWKLRFKSFPKRLSNCGLHV